MINKKFAQIENDIVVNIVEIPHFSYDLEEQEKSGIAFLKDLTGIDSWLYVNAHNGECLIGDYYDKELDAFISPKPESRPSWILNEKYEWIPPIPKPEDNTNYYWDEKNINWSTTPVKE